jgi:hypothetical protein
MNFVLNNRLKVSATVSHSGRVKSVAASLDPLNMTGYTMVDFFKNGSARETCVSTSDGFVSVKTFQDNHLIMEMFKDVVHQKTFYYVYGTDGKVIETSIDSQNKNSNNSIHTSRDILVHAPVCLYDELRTAPQMLIRGKCLAIDLSHKKQKEHTRVA